MLAVPAVQAEKARRPFVAYHASWYEPPAKEGSATRLARLPSYITHVALSFVRPDLAYPGGLNLDGTGLEYKLSGEVLRDAVRELKARNPDTKVLLAVGGANYHGWSAFDPDALARLVSDLGADGVDIDFEPRDPACITLGGRIACATDAQFIDIVEQTRAALPRPLTVSAAGWSVGAFGEGDFADAPPRSPWRGSMLRLLRSPAAASLDLVSIMSYDAGPQFRPDQALRAYRAAWKGQLALGIQVLPGSSGGPRFTLGYTESVLRAVRNDPQAGAMLYALNEVPEGKPGPDNPDYRSLSAAICFSLELGDCAQPVP